MNVEYKHHWELDREAWYVRFYLWLYEADPERADFCKMFWGYVFVMPMLILRGLFAIADYIDRKTLPWRKRREQERHKKQTQALTGEWQRKRRGDKSLALRFIEGVGRAVSKVVMAISAITHEVSRHHRLNRFIGHAFLTLAGLLGLTGIVGLVYLAVTNLTTTGVIVGLLAAVAMAVVIAVALKTVGFYDWTRAKVGKPAKQGTLGFFGMLKQGFIAVKSNTCPDVTIK